MITITRGKAIGVCCDVTKIDQVEAAAAEAEENFGMVTLLINNAGVCIPKPLLEVEDSEAEFTMNVNYLALRLTTKRFLPEMERKRKGHIVTISSVAGTLSVPGQIDYNASKFAAFAFDEGLRNELQKRSSPVKTTCFCPFFVDTGMFEGAGNHFLLPMLKCDWVSKRIISAIRQEEKVVITPFLCSLNFSLRNLVPVSVFDLVQKIMQTYTMLDKIKGR